MIKNKEINKIIDYLKNKHVFDISFKNSYNFTNYQLRVDPEKKTIERGSWTWGDVYIYSRNDLKIIIDLLLAVGFRYE